MAERATYTIRRVDGRRVRMEDGRLVESLEPFEVERSGYWTERINQGDVELAEREKRKRPAKPAKSAAARRGSAED